jgi:hypothetical protein
MADIQKQDKTGEAFNTAGAMIAEGATIRQMQTTYATAVAVQKERELPAVLKRCLEEANLAGESIYYGWSAGKDRIEGPSVKCAMIAFLNWGNTALEMLPVQETHNAYIFTAAAIDLERGVTITRQFRQSKNWTVYGKLDEFRKEDIRFQIGQSKASRNVILNFIPSWLIDKMIEQAKEGVRKKLESYIAKNGLEAARQLTLKALAKHGVTQERIEDRIGMKYGAWDTDQLVVLRGDIKALDDGAENAETLFPLAGKEVDLNEPEKKQADLGDMEPGDTSRHQGHELDLDGKGGKK